MIGVRKSEQVKEKVEMPGIEPGASRMQSERSTTELHPLVYTRSAKQEFRCFHLYEITLTSLPLPPSSLPQSLPKSSH